MCLLSSPLGHGLLGQGPGIIYVIHICVVNGGASPPCGVFKDHSSESMEIAFWKAYEIKGFTILAAARRGRHTHHSRITGEDSQGSGLSQASGELRGKSLSPGSEQSIQEKDMKGFHWYICMLLGHGKGRVRRGICGQEPNYSRAPGQREGLLIACLWGCWSIRNIWRFKIYNTPLFSMVYGI